MRVLGILVIVVTGLLISSCNNEEGSSSRHVPCERVRIVLTDGSVLAAKASPEKARESFWGNVIEEEIPLISEYHCGYRSIESAKTGLISEHSRRIGENNHWVGEINIERDSNGQIRSGSVRVITENTVLTQDNFTFKDWTGTEEVRTVTGSHRIPSWFLSGTIRYKPEIEIEEFHFGGPVTIEYLGSGPGVIVYEKRGS